MSQAAEELAQTLEKMQKRLADVQARREALRQAKAAAPAPAADAVSPPGRKPGLPKVLAALAAASSLGTVVGIVSSQPALIQWSAAAALLLLSLRALASSDARSSRPPQGMRSGEDPALAEELAELRTVVSSLLKALQTPAENPPSGPETP